MYLHKLMSVFSHINFLFKTVVRGWDTYFVLVSCESLSPSDQHEN